MLRFVVERLLPSQVGARRDAVLVEDRRGTMSTTMSEAEIVVSKSSESRLTLLVELNAGERRDGKIVRVEQGEAQR